MPREHPDARSREEVRRLLELSALLGAVRAAEVAVEPRSPQARLASTRARQLEREIDRLAGRPVRHLPKQRRTLRRWQPRQIQLAR